MIDTIRAFRRLAACSLAALILAVSAGLAGADTIHLKDGRVVEGEITRESETFVYLAQREGGVERTRLFLKDEIEKIVRDGQSADDQDDAGSSEDASPSSPDEDAGDDEAPEEPPARAEASSESNRRERPAAEQSAGAVRLAFISLEGTVGLEMYADALTESVELLEDDDPDIVVLRINSGGGIGAEVKPLSDVIENEIKPKYRVVAWIESAISAAAMTAITCEEIYFMSEGNFGAATGYRATSSGNKAIEGEELQEMLEMMEGISRRGDYDPLIMRAMQVPTDLSCDIDEYGMVRWRNDLRGEHIVSTAENTSILTFNSTEAIKYNFAQAVADSKGELARRMGVSEWVEVGEDADRHQRDFRETMSRAQAKAGELRGKIQVAMENGRPARARRFLGQLRSWVRRAPPLSKYMGLNDEWFRRVEEAIREMSRDR